MKSSIKTSCSYARNAGKEEKIASSFQKQLNLEIQSGADLLNTPGKGISLPFIMFTSYSSCSHIRASVKNQGEYQRVKLLRILSQAPISNNPVFNARF